MKSTSKPPEDSPAIEFSRSNSVGLILVAAGLAGCSGANGIENVLAPHPDTNNTITLAGKLAPTRIGLFNPAVISVEGEPLPEVRVGQNADQTLKVFPSPPKYTDLDDLPYAFSPKVFESKGWQTSTGEGFGVLMTDEKVVAAVYQVEKATPDLIDNFTKAEEAGLRPLKPKHIDAADVHYTFWHEKTQTAMLSVYTTQDGTNLTMAMGDDSILKAVNVSEEDAQAQIDQLQRIAKMPPK